MSCPAGLNFFYAVLGLFLPVGILLTRSDPKFSGWAINTTSSLAMGVYMCMNRWMDGRTDGWMDRWID